MPEDNLAKQGIDAYLAGDEENARRLLVQALEQDPHNADAWYYLSRIYNDPEKVRTCLQRALKAKPEHERAQRALRELDSISEEAVSVHDERGMDSADVYYEDDPFDDLGVDVSGMDQPGMQGDDSPLGSLPPAKKPSNEVEFPHSPFSRSTPKSKPADDTPAGKPLGKPSGKPFGNPFSRSASSGGNPSSNRPTGNRPTGNRPASNRPASNRPATMSYKFGMPSGIPGAPDRLSLEELWDFWKRNFKEGVRLLTQQNSTVDRSDASWWNVWLIVFSVGFFTALILLITIVFTNPRALGVMSIVSVPLLVTVQALIGFGAGAYFTHWYMTTQARSSATLLDHAYTLVMIWGVASLANLALFVIARVIGAGIITFPAFVSGGILNASFLTILMTLIAAGLVAYTAYRMRQTLEHLYGTRLDPRQYWVAALLMLIIVSLVF